jgi:hypothetical protein
LSARAFVVDSVVGRVASVRVLGGALNAELFATGATFREVELWGEVPLLRALLFEAKGTLGMGAGATRVAGAD